MLQHGLLLKASHPSPCFLDVIQVTFITRECEICKKLAPEYAKVAANLKVGGQCSASQKRSTETCNRVLIALAHMAHCKPLQTRCFHTEHTQSPHTA